MKREPTTGPKQGDFYALIWRPYRYPFRLHAGDVIRIRDRICRVIRVNECAAVVTMNQPVRDFITRFDKHARFQPAPLTFRIASNSEVEILNRRSSRRCR